MSFLLITLKYYIQKNKKKVYSSLKFHREHTHVTTTQIKKHITSTLEAPTAITQLPTPLPSLLKLWTYIYQENTTREMEKVSFENWKKIWTDLTRYWYSEYAKNSHNNEEKKDTVNTTMRKAPGVKASKKGHLCSQQTYKECTISLNIKEMQVKN